MIMQDAFFKANRFIDETIRPDHDLEIVIASCEEFETAWVFEYNTRKLIEDNDLMASLVGNGPVVIPKSGAAPYLASSATPVNEQVQ